MEQGQVSLSPGDDLSPIALAPNIWWVGHILAGDPFQCHVYLIVHGDHSVLIDPGSNISLAYTLRKVQQLISLTQIRYIICHHQDPDITASLPQLDRMALHPQVEVVSHWRAIHLLKHYDIRIPFLCVEKAGWMLDLGEGRQLEFIFTPYLHFPGAFCTFDRTTGILFSSDLFGGFTVEPQLFAQDESYFDGVRPFHEHYMPSQDILHYGLSRLEPYPIQMIAPQHGSVIPERLVPFMFQQLKSLDCGLFLMSQTNSEAHRLSALNRTLRGFLESLYLYRDFQEIAQALLLHARNILPASRLEFFALTAEGQTLHLAPESLYRGEIAQLPDILKNILAANWNDLHERVLLPFPGYLLGCNNEAYPAETGLVIPLFRPSERTASALALFGLSGEISIDADLVRILGQLNQPLSVAVERELLYRALDLERQRFYEQSIRDPLTGLYTRFLMQEAVQRLLDIHDRDPNARVAVVVMDIDHFKRINDQFGHNSGDLVLTGVATIIQQQIRKGDIPVRLGGEEFAVFIVGATDEMVFKIAERVRQEIEATTFPLPVADYRVTLSGGVAFHHCEEGLRELIERADQALYRAKESGRNRILPATA